MPRYFLHKTKKSFKVDAADAVQACYACGWEPTDSVFVGIISMKETGQPLQPRDRSEAPDLVWSVFRHTMLNYWRSRKGKVWHFGGCPNAQKIREGDRLYVTSHEEAEMLSLIPCRHCFPITDFDLWDGNADIGATYFQRYNC